MANLKAKLLGVKSGNVALFIALLFHLSGFVGMLTSSKEWFIANTPFTLVLMFLLVVYTQAEKSTIFLKFLSIAYSVGFLVEVIGVNTGILFGNYAYGSVLGFKLLQVPLLIGVNWFVTVFAAANCVQFLHSKMYFRFATNEVSIGATTKEFLFVFDTALLTTIFDWIMEPAAIKLGMWHWLPSGQIPLYNYVCWFLITALIALLFRKQTKLFSNQFVVHLLITQALFFIAIRLFL